MREAPICYKFMKPKTDIQLAKILLMHAVDPMLENCGNSYANAYTEQWLHHAKQLGAYHGRTIGNIRELMDEWEVWLDANGGLPEWPEELQTILRLRLTQTPEADAKARNQ